MINIFQSYSFCIFRIYLNSGQTISAISFSSYMAIKDSLISDSCHVKYLFSWFKDFLPFFSKKAPDIDHLTKQLAAGTLRGSPHATSDATTTPEHRAAGTLCILMKDHILRISVDALDFPRSKLERKCLAVLYVL